MAQLSACGLAGPADRDHSGSPASTTTYLGETRPELTGWSTAGLRVVPEAEAPMIYFPNAPEPSAARLRLSNLYRGTHALAPTSSSVQAERKEWRFSRGAGVDEWYRYHQRGLEHGFDVLDSPPGSHSIPITLVVNLEGLRAESDTGGRIGLRSATGHRVASYGKLVVRDARGYILPSTLRAADDEIHIVFSDEGAVYPVEVDPLLWREGEAIVDSPRHPGEWFGGSLAVSDEWLLIGSRDYAGNDRGGVVALRWDGTDWKIVQRFVSPSPEGRLFGESIALAEATAVACDPREGDGSCYAMQLENGLWTRTQKLQPPETDDIDSFGDSVALDGTTLVISSTDESGRVYVYEWVGSEWSLKQTLMSPLTHTQSYYGNAVAVDEDRLVVAARYANSVFTYRLDGGRWTQDAELRPTTPYAFDFGAVISLHGPSLWVGEPGWNSWRGRVSVFSKVTGDWLLEAELEVDEALPDQFLGSSVLAGENFGITTRRVGEQEVARAYRKVGGVWLDDGDVSLSSHDVADWFGSAVGYHTLSKSILVGAPLAEQQRGAVYPIRYALELGDPCINAPECHSQQCADSVCCESSCGPCGSCDGELGPVGTCVTRPSASTPGGPCNGFRCDGVQVGCPSRCGGSSDCLDAFYCDGRRRCTARFPNGAACESNDECSSTHCVEGVCCDNACSGACDSCVVEAFIGVCKLVPRGNRGSPRCDPYVCNGELAVCPSGCQSHGECSISNRCIDQQCQPALDFGQSCTDNTTCLSGYCTDGVCCVRGSCGAYRCSAEGACPEECSSSSQCGTGFECSSFGRCVAVESEDGGSSSSDGCSVSGHRSAPASQGNRSAFLGALLVIASMVRSRRRVLSRLTVCVGLSSLGAASLLRCSPDPSVSRSTVERQTSSILISAPQLIVAPAVDEQSEFGRAIAVQGATLAVSGLSWSYEDGGYVGQVHIHQLESGNWSRTATLNPETIEGRDRFGAALAIEDNVLVVGDPGDLGAAGSVTLYEHRDNRWMNIAKLTGSPERFDFGMILAKQTNLLACVSADEPNGDRGQVVHLFRESGGQWTESQVFSASQEWHSSAFGTGLAIDGTDLMIGAKTMEGRVLIYDCSHDPCQHKTTLVTSEWDSYHAFGEAISVQGNAMLVGAPDPFSGYTGTAFFFRRTALGWFRGAMVAPPATVLDGLFGSAVHVDGKLAVVGAPRAHDWTGQAYLYKQLPSDEWVEVQELVRSNAQPDDEFGISVAVQSEFAFVASPGTNNEAGVVYAYPLVAKDVGTDCSSDDQCLSEVCSEGVCCDRRCNDACESCILTSTKGTCSLLEEGSAPRTACDGLLCDGLQHGCALACGGHGECLPGYYCNAAQACVPSRALGSFCTEGALCASGFCSDSVCCDSACDAPCDECDVEGSIGTCKMASHGVLGEPPCEPFVCSGVANTCPTVCATNADCSVGLVCIANACVNAIAPGLTCASAAECATNHCVDRVCCLSQSCGNYRCGSDGACKQDCSSDAECSDGFACNSSARCERSGDSTAATSDGCSCRSLPQGRDVPYLAWAIAGCALAFRRRNQSKR